MKQLSSMLCLTALALFVLSCKKDKDSTAPKFHTPCETVLDNWDIKVLPFPETQRQNDLFFINEEMGFTVGNAGTILKTTNGGQDWKFVERYYDLTTNSIVQGALTKARLVTVFFVDESVGYVGGEGENTPISGDNIDAVLLKTTDGGDSWSKQYLPGIRAVKDLYFFDADNGLAIFLGYDENNYLKQKLFTTHNGGATWETVPMPNLTVSSSQMDISPASVGVWVVENYSSSKYLRSTDQGATWQEIQIPSTECSAIGFQTDALGYAHCDGKSYETTDGGISWQEITPTLSGVTLKHFNSTAEGFAFVPVYDIKSGGGESWQVLNSFEVYQTADGGLTWKKSLIEKDCDFTGTRFDYSDEVFFTLGWQAVNKFMLH
jgi:photosystem II stability/assembly factor-like uncharacterized protein